MNAKVNALLVAALGLSAIVFASSSTQAAVVCDEDGDCWHTREAYTYPPAAGVIIHGDDWHWEGDSYRWREHEGRGYWRGGVWTDF